MDDQTKQRLKEVFCTHGFDRSLVGIELTEIGAGHARARLVVTDPLQNMGGTLHGGAIATIVDDVGTIAIMTADRDSRPGVTTDLNVSYFAPGMGGRAVIADGVVLKSGKTLAFVQVEIRREDDQALVAQGRMTKFMGS
jgi:acyl-coenzyme A thioesterase 13